MKGEQSIAHYGHEPGLGDEPEVWYEPDWLPNHSVSNYAKIWSWASGSLLKVRERTSGNPTRDGKHYLQITLYVSKEIGYRTFLVNRLICSAAYGNLTPGEEARHADGDPWNNRLNNLRPGTKGENALDRVAAGYHTRRHATSECGRRLNGTASEDLGKAMADGAPVLHIAGVFGCSVRSCYDALKRHHTRAKEARS